MRHPLSRLSLALLAVALHANAPHASGARAPRAVVRVGPVAEPPALTRLAWGSVNLLVYADSVHGVQLWAATTSRDPRTRGRSRQRDFAGRFHPAAVERWAEVAGVVIQAQQPVPGDTASMVSVLLIERDSAVAGLYRRRDGDRLDPRVFLYFAPKSGKDPLVIQGQAKDALAFANAMLYAAMLSRVAHPDSASSAGVYHDNPIDPTTAVEFLSGGAPRYPAVLQQSFAQGEVWARFVVDSTGRVDPATFEPLLSDHEHFTASVRAFLAGARFKPATRGGRPVGARVAQRFVFRMGWE